MENNTKKICVELNEYNAELGRTVEAMLSPDYNERFRAEYYQLDARYRKLDAMLAKAHAGTLEFTLTCPVNLLEWQLEVMGHYLAILERRAILEGVSL